MQKKLNKKEERMKAPKLKIIIFFIMWLILWWLISIWSIIYYFRAEFNFINENTKTHISNTQPSWIYILDSVNEIGEYISYNFHMLNSYNIKMNLLNNEYQRVSEVYPYSTKVFFNINFSGNKIESREMIDPKEWTKLWNNVNNVNWGEYLSGSIIKMSEFKSLRSFGPQWDLFLYNDTKETKKLNIKDDKWHNREYIHLLPGEYYFWRTYLESFKLEIINDNEDRFKRDKKLIDI